MPYSNNELCKRLGCNQENKSAKTVGMQGKYFFIEKLIKKEIKNVSLNWPGTHFCTLDKKIQQLKLNPSNESNYAETVKHFKKNDH